LIVVFLAGSEALSRKWLSKMPDVCRGDAALVRLVIKRDGVALQHASEELKAGELGKLMEHHDVMGKSTNSGYFQ